MENKFYWSPLATGLVSRAFHALKYLLLLSRLRTNLITFLDIDYCVVFTIAQKSPLSLNLGLSPLVAMFVEAKARDIAVSMNNKGTIVSNLQRLQ